MDSELKRYIEAIRPQDWTYRHLTALRNAIFATIPAGELVGDDDLIAQPGKMAQRIAAQSAELEQLRAEAQALVDAMETCHQCKGTVLVEEQPTHCEDCTYDCDSHEGAECPTIYGLHLALKMALAARAHAPQKESNDAE
jgi:hypothetical protein